MRSFCSRLFSSPILLAPMLLAVLALPLAAQQRVCLSVHQGPATGTNNTGQPAQLAARVEGVQVSVPTAAGQTAAQASAAHEAAFVAAGFTTVRVAPNKFCVTAAPGGAPITRGLAYGTDDTNLDLDADVGLLPPPAGGDPKAKGNGAVVPLPNPAQPPVPFGGVITIYITIESGGVTVTICIQISIAPNMPGSVLQQMIIQQLNAQGFGGHRIKMHNPLNPGTVAGQLIDAYQLERTMAGEPVIGVEYVYDALSRRIVNNVTGAGLLPVYGAAEYGRATQGLSPTMPLSRVPGPPPQINSFFDVFHDVGLPNAIGGFLLSTGPAALPVFNGVVLVDPSAWVIELQLTSPTGMLARHWVVPPVAGLIGFPLHSQGFAAIGNVLTMSTGLAIVIGP